MKKSHSFIAIPPGVTIKEQLVERNMRQKEFATRMGMSEKHISRLINGEVQLTIEVARKLEMVLGLPVQFWCNLETIYREKLVKIKEEQEIAANEVKNIAIVQEIEIAERMPYENMVEKGWLVDVSEISQKVFHLRKYFEVAELKFLQETLIPRVACRKLSGKEKNDCELIAWVQKAKMIARERKAKQIDVTKLQEEIPHIKELIQKKGDMMQIALMELLAEYGVVLVFLPRISEGLPYGATFLDGNKIIILLDEDVTDKKEFQISLFHEIAHIILGHIEKNEGTSDEDEKCADKFVKEYLDM